ncbi:16S rRNA (guanine(527)-N(7))-methyltransferase RsmG [Planococcus shenhongbingii]|uniref:Ribosomal RNA small subunit methyltransferase G n=1 Tax=Planococcus shenhongbingii TaxID=3058398 RepID=A0ABT8NCA9_9BACL|nr:MULTISPECIES: 16S rRNA (guanine(527)-N(7))-methyltransferase RsmG [unclassified Planococcus (in: firmicutes)]MDN7245518.1 16S rRNA (guanine(527)-N(7))-methyltransferase RsmG [Planococcus sp. N017]WKA58607.1 16S rRNA (guanine(527)-N(7))-methyltransferase RsmG [Planococcus sp. N016]
MNEQQFKDALSEKGIQLSELQMDQFQIYFKELVEWNEKMNLTAITDQPSVYLKHFFDSITAAFYLDFTKPLKVCDVGAGAGFPSIPLKICFPHIEVTIVDSLNKRIQFLTHLSDKLNLSNVQFIHSRAEDFGQSKHRESYDLVTARAVARLSVLAELCVPLVKNGGIFAAMKAASAPDELKDAEKALLKLGVKEESIHSFKLPIEESDRYIQVFRKFKETPKKYPRKPGIPNKSPIT